MIDNDLLYRYTQRAALAIFCAPNITLSLKKYRIPADLDIVDTQKAETHKDKVFAKSVNDLRLWKKGPQEDGWTTFESIQERVDLQRDYLLYKHKGKYRFIKDEDIPTLYDWLVFSAIIRTTEHLHAKGLLTDLGVRQRVALYLSQRENNVGMAKAVGHARKHNEDVTLAIDTAYREALDHSEDAIELPSIGPGQTGLSLIIEPLPPLPEGIGHALSWYRLLG